jgi:hypothetical protein
MRFPTAVNNASRGREFDCSSNIHGTCKDIRVEMRISSGELWPTLSSSFSSQNMCRAWVPITVLNEAQVDRMKDLVPRHILKISQRRIFCFSPFLGVPPTKVWRAGRRCAAIQLSLFLLNTLSAYGFIKSSLFAMG